MTTRKQLIYKMKAKGQFVKKYNQNVKSIELIEKTQDYIVFFVIGTEDSCEFKFYFTK